MNDRKNKLPKRRIATTKEILRFARKRLVRRKGASLPFYILPAQFHLETRLKTSFRRFFRVLNANGFIPPRQKDGIFIQGLALKGE